MNNTDYTWFFIIMTMFNSSLGMSNVEKNLEQENREKRIEEKLNKILEMMSNNEQ